MDFISAAFSCLPPFPPSFPPSFPASPSSLLSAAASPQALKESLTLHTHNHFRPGCLGRHLRWDVPATRCRPNQTAVQRKLKKKKENLKTWTPRVNQRSGGQTCVSVAGLRASGSGRQAASPPLTGGFRLFLRFQEAHFAITPPRERT